MESLVTWFATTLGPYISEKAVVFLISMMPRGTACQFASESIRCAGNPDLYYRKYFTHSVYPAVYQEDLPVDEKSKMFPGTDRKTGKSGDGKK